MLFQKKSVTECIEHAYTYNDYFFEEKCAFFNVFVPIFEHSCGQK